MSNSVQPHRWKPTKLCCPWDSPGKTLGEQKPKGRMNSILKPGKGDLKQNKFKKKRERNNEKGTSLFLHGEFHGQRNLEATVHSVAKSWTGLKPLSAHTRGREEEGLFGEGEEAELYPEGPR